MILNILTLMFIFGFLLFYLDNFALSTNKSIKILQILTPILLILSLIIFIYFNLYTLNEIFWLDQDKNTISVGANLEINKDAAEAIGRNIGIAGTIAGVSGAVAKGIAKSSMPPLQKAGIIIGAGVASGAIFVGTSAVNRVVNTTTTISPKSTSSINISSNINKLLPDSNDGLSDLILLLLSINTLICVCISLIVILSLMIIFKFYLDENKIKLNISNLLGNKLNDNLNYYLIKLIQLNKKTSAIYILMILIILLISLGFSCYFVTELYNNLDKFIELYINSKK